MLKTINTCKLLGTGAAVAIMGAMAAPVSAQQIIIIDRGGFHRGYQQPAVGSFIYGSPIATPMPVNPSTGLMPRRIINYSYPQYRRKLKNTTLVNPVLVNPRIRKSKLINPTIIRDSRYPRPRRDNSRIIIYPGYGNY